MCREGLVLQAHEDPNDGAGYHEPDHHQAETCQCTSLGPAPLDLAEGCNTKGTFGWRVPVSELRGRVEVIEEEGAA